MTNTARSLIHTGIGLLMPCLLITSGCGPSQQELMARDHLANAQAAYARAAADPDIKTNAPIPLQNAGRAVETAARAEEYDEMDHLAYLADKKVRIAVATAEEQLAEQDKKTLEWETEQLMAQAGAREQRATMAARESNMQARESNMQARESNAHAWSLVEKTENATARADMLQTEIDALKGRMTERGIVLTIGDVLFDTDSADLTPRADNEIRRVSDFMKQYPERNVLIEGHTDNTGSQRENLGLSQQRADSVGNSIAAHGISTRRITTRGLGQELPVASNTTAQGRQQNRRVDVTILNEGVSPLAQRQ